MTAASSLAVLLLLGAGPARAQTAPPAKLLSWEDCVRAALSRNPDLASSASSVEASRANYRGSYNGVLPSVRLSNSYDDSSSHPANKWSADVTASLDLIDAARFASIRASSALLTQAQAARRVTSATVRFGLRQAYAQLLFAERSVEVSRSIRDLRANGARLVGLRYQSGRESKGNMLRARAQLAQAEAALAQATRDVRTSQTGLDRQLGFDDFEAVAATGALVAAPAPPFPASPSTLLASRPDVAVQQAAVESARAALSSARSTLFPSLSADYTRGRVGPKEFPNAATSWSGGFTISYPLFGGGPTSTYYAIKAADRGFDRAQQDLRVARDQAVVDLQSSWASYAAAAENVDVQHALLEAARQRNAEADVRYASGLLSYDNWEIIATDRINTERQAVSADLNAVVAQAAWQRALGMELGQ